MIEACGHPARPLVGLVGRQPALLNQSCLLRAAGALVQLHALLGSVLLGGLLLGLVALPEGKGRGGRARVVCGRLNGGEKGEVGGELRGAVGGRGAGTTATIMNNLQPHPPTPLTSAVLGM